MLRFLLGLTKMDTIRNEYIRHKTQQFGDKVREEKLRWFRYVPRSRGRFMGMWQETCRWRQLSEAIEGRRRRP